MKKVLIFLIIIVYGNILHAQEDHDIVADRPDQTESSWTIPKHRVQIESGFLYRTTKTDNATFKETVYQGTLMRYGLLDNFELRVATAYSETELEVMEGSTDTAGTATGFEPLVIGFKVLIVEEKGWIPRMTFVGSMIIPRAASKEKQVPHYAPSFRFTGEYTITDWVSFGFNVGTDWSAFEANAIGYLSGVFGFSVLPWLGAFAEYYSYLPGGAGNNQHNVDGGFTFPVRPNLQFDASAGIGLSEESPDYFVAAGFSWRIPK
jgi:hypothetical protein